MTTNMPFRKKYLITLVIISKSRPRMSCSLRIQTQGTAESLSLIAYHRKMALACASPDRGDICLFLPLGRAKSCVVVSFDCLCHQYRWEQWTLVLRILRLLFPTLAMLLLDKSLS